MWGIPTVHPASFLRGGKPISDVVTADLRKAWRLAQPGAVPNQHENFVIVHPGNPDPLEHVVRVALEWMRCWRLRQVPTSVDIETSGLNMFRCNLYSIALSGVDGNDVAVAWTLQGLNTLPWEAERVLTEELRLLLAEESVTKIYQNSPYDRCVLSAKGFTIRGRTIDTQGLAHIVQPDIPKDLGFIGHTYLDVEPWKISDHGGKKAATEDVIELLVYNAKDALNTGKLVDPLMREIAERGMSQQLITYQNAFADLATDMELAGLPINYERRAQMGAELLGKIEKAKAELRELLQWPDFNPMNNAHRVEVYYGDRYLKLKPTAWSEKTHTPTTSYKSETLIDRLEDPIISRIVKVQEWQVRHTRLYSPKGAFASYIERDRRMHPQWNCYDAETEVLTDKGFIKFPEAVKRVDGLKFAQYDPDSESISFVKGSNPVAAAGAKLLQVKSEQVDLRVTPNHRQLLRERPGRKKRVHVLAAGELRSNLRWVHAGTHLFSPTGLDLGENGVRLLVAAQADGSLIGNTWRFNFNKERKYRRLLSILDALDHDYTCKDLGPELPSGYTCRYSVRLATSSLTGKLKDLLRKERSWGPWLYDMTMDEAEAFSAEVTKWDGSQEGLGGRYNTTVADNAMWVQIIACLTGRRAHVSKHQFQGGSGWRVNIRKRRFSAVKKPSPAVAMRGTHTVYCVNVPTSFLVVRRGGKVVISGNSAGQKGSRFSSKDNVQNWPKEDRDFIEAPPGRCFVGADKDQLELRVAAARAGVRELIEEMAKPDGDPHTLASKHVWPGFMEKDKSERKKLRDAVKNVVYASLYMAMVKTVWHTVREKKYLSVEMRAALTLPVVSHIYHSYLGKFVEFKRYHDAKYDKIQRDYFIEAPPLGRRRYFPIPALAEYNEVANWDVQVIGSDFVGVAMVHIQDELKRRYNDAWIIMHGHDQVVVECWEKDAESIKKLVDHLFGNDIVDGPAGPVRLTAKAKVGRTLLDVK